MWPGEGSDPSPIEELYVAASSLDHLFPKTKYCLHEVGVVFLIYNEEYRIWKSRGDR